MCNFKPLTFALIATFFSVFTSCNSDLTFLTLKRKSHDLNSKGFSKTIKFISHRFQRRDFNCTAVEVTEANFKTSACLFTFYLRNDFFCLQLTTKRLTFLLLKCGMSRKFCCLFTGSLRSLFGLPV